MPCSQHHNPQRKHTPQQQLPGYHLPASGVPALYAHKAAQCAAYKIGGHVGGVYAAVCGFVERVYGGNVGYLRGLYANI